MPSKKNLMIFSYCKQISKLMYSRDNGRDSLPISRPVPRPTTQRINPVSRQSSLKEDDPKKVFVEDDPVNQLIRIQQKFGVADSKPRKKA